MDVRVSMAMWDDPCGYNNVVRIGGSHRPVGGYNVPIVVMHSHNVGGKILL